MDYKALFRKFESLHLLVIGDVMIDSYLFGQVDRISPEAPVPVVALQKRESRLGGAANVALNLRAMGAKVSIASVIGDDKYGEKLQVLFSEAGINTDGLIRSKGRRTTVKYRVIGNNHQMLRIDEEDTGIISSMENGEMLAYIREHISEFDGVVFEDYDKGVLLPDNIASIIGIAERAGKPTVVDPKKRNFLAYKGATLFKPNLKEIREGLKTDLDLKTETNLKTAVNTLFENLHNKLVMVTLSEQGVMISDREHWIRVAAHVRNIADVSGAGDTVVSVAALCLAAGCELKTIAELSNLAGGLVCEKVGVVPVNRDEFLTEAEKLNR